MEDRTDGWADGWMDGWQLNRGQKDGQRTERWRTEGWLAGQEMEVGHKHAGRVGWARAGAGLP